MLDAQYRQLVKLTAEAVRGAGPAQQAQQEAQQDAAPGSAQLVDVTSPKRAEAAAGAMPPADTDGLHAQISMLQSQVGVRAVWDA